MEDTDLLDLRRKRGFRHGPDDPRDLMENIRLFGTEVGPRVRELLRPLGRMRP
jgi:hypothetical protein